MEFTLHFCDWNPNSFLKSWIKINFNLYVMGQNYNILCVGTILRQCWYKFSVAGIIPQISYSIIKKILPVELIETYHLKVNVNSIEQSCF